jgi:hypothetical protein
MSLLALSTIHWTTVVTISKRYDEYETVATVPVTKPQSSHQPITQLLSSLRPTSRNQHRSLIDPHPNYITQVGTLHCASRCFLAFASTSEYVPYDIKEAGRHTCKRNGTSRTSFRLPFGVTKALPNLHSSTSVTMTGRDIVVDLLMTTRKRAEGPTLNHPPSQAENEGRRAVAGSASGGRICKQ